jgi:CBS domain-containing protein
VYGGDGGLRSWSTPLDSPGWANRPPPKPTIASDVPIADIMTTRLVCARADLAIEVLAKLFVDHHIGCVPIVDERGSPVGIVTKADLVENLGKAGGTTADVMTPLAITLDERATVADAAEMLISEDFHHVMIISEARMLIGVVSTKDVVRWLYDNDRAARE